MKTLEPKHTISNNPIRKVYTRGASIDELVNTSQRANNDSQQWDFWIDNYLIEWGRNPGLFDTAEIEPPSESVIDLACQLARKSRDAGITPPLRVIPDGEGGISFERKSDSDFQSLNILAEGIIELLTFEHRKLISKESFPIPSIYLD